MGDYKVTYYDYSDSKVHSERSEASLSVTVERAEKHIKENVSEYRSYTIERMLINTLKNRWSN